VRSGGWLVVAEKVTQPSALWQEIANEATWDYKADRGVSAETIRAKARALRGVLRPLSSGEVEASMLDAGWRDVVPIWRWHCWGLWAATAL
jgi:tRNA (cmo5U34)-methyltransferase